MLHAPLPRCWRAVSRMSRQLVLTVQSMRRTKCSFGLAGADSTIRVSEPRPMALRCVEPSAPKPMSVTLSPRRAASRAR